MKHVVILSEVEQLLKDAKIHKWVVIEIPPLILTWHGMYFMQTSQERFLKSVHYKYVEVEGVPLSAISTSEEVE